MTEQTTPKTEKMIESNKLIAEFMELKMHDSISLAKTPLKCYEFNYGLHSLHELKFHFSWDWLMPVVEKIENLGNRTKIEFNSISTQVTIYDHAGNIRAIEWNNPSTKIEKTYKAVVQFIKWYNANPESLTSTT